MVTNHHVPGVFMLKGNIRVMGVVRRAVALVLFVFAVNLPVWAQQQSIAASSTAAGTMIFNRARVLYTEPEGAQAVAVTRTVVVTVVVVNGVTVTPDESSSSGEIDSNELVTVRFEACNTGNNSLPLVLSAATVTAPAEIDSIFLDSDSSGTISDSDLRLVINTTVMPSFAAGACKNVLMRYRVNGAQAKSEVLASITARSAASADGSPVQDSGTIIRTVKDKPILADPDNPNLPPRKSVNNQEEVTVGAGAVVQYEVAFRNYGEGEARGVRVIDELPAGVTFEAGSLRLVIGSVVTPLTEANDGDGGVVTGQRLDVNVPSVVPQQVVAIRFGARVASLPGGTLLVNRAQVSAENFALVNSREARVVIAPQGMVFDGGVGSAGPVRAQLRIVAVDPQGPLLGLVPATGFVPNEANSNPYATGADGLFSFRITRPLSVETYYLLVDAEGYRSRSIECVVSPASENRFNVRMVARDGQPLAGAGGYALTESAVEINNLSALVSNIPVFTTGDLQISKTADRRSASIGDVVTYRVEVRNTARTASYGVEISDRLPESFYYVPGSGQLQVSGFQSRVIDPEIAGDSLTFRIQTVPGGGTATLIYRVRIGVNARVGEQFNVAVARSGGNATPPVRVGVVVRAGVFSTNQFIIGRVFVDMNGNGRFDVGDRAVSAARLITQNGHVVLTDAAGNYNIPVIGDGPVVLQLDRSSVPEGAVPHDPLKVDGSSWSRLFSTPLLGGAMLQADFALTAGAVSRDGKAPAGQSGDGRLDEPAASGGDASAGSSAKSAVSQSSSHRKRGSWLRRLVRSVFGGSQKAGNVSDERSQSSSGAAAPGPVSPLPSPASAVSHAPGSTESAYPEVATSTNPYQVPVRIVAVSDSGAMPGIGLSDGARVAKEAAGVLKVLPGNIELDVEPDSVSVKPGLDVPVRVAMGWGAKLYVNEKVVDESRMGERRSDQSTQSEQLMFVGLDLVPGPNRLRAVAIAPDGTPRAMREVVVYGRGPAVRFELVPEVSEIPAGRRASTVVVVRAFDEWGNPAQDGDVALQTTLGSVSSASAPVAAEASVTGTGIEAFSRRQVVGAPAIQQELGLKLEGGRALVRLESSDAPGTARITVANGVATVSTEVRFGLEDRPRMLVGYGQLTIGRNAPVMSLRGVDDRTWRASAGFFFRGSLGNGHVLTLAYDTDRPLSRLDGQDRLFQLDPLENSYQVFGDTSTRFLSAQSNTKAYARVDLSRHYGRSYLLFGDYVPEKRDAELASYNRRITGGLFHFENEHGDYFSFGGAAPSTLFGRDVFPGSQFGFARLSATLILAGSENVWLEVRDRRNPDLIIKRDQLVRGVDYNLDTDSGQIFFKRAIDVFDAELNLRQIVVTYEYRATGAGALVYHARASKKFRAAGTRVGFTAVLQQQNALGNFALGGVDFSQETPNGGMLRLEYARSTGKVIATGNYDVGSDTLVREGNAYLATYDQPLRWRMARLQASFRSAGAGFSNPFGGTVVAGARRAGVALDLQATGTARVRVGFTDERNSTERVHNSRQTFSAQWSQRVSDRLTATLGYDYRRLRERDSETSETNVTNSQLVTAGIEWRPTDRLSLSVRREQNLGKADPTYPNQTVLSAFYKLNDTSRLFVTQALRSAAIAPISDLSGGGFGVSQSKAELTAGIETKLARDTSLLGGYRVEKGVDGSDGYAVVGLGRKWKVNEALALDASYERAFHLTGKAPGGYNTLSSGVTWRPRENFIATSGYQWRDRDGSLHTLAAGFTGKASDSVTAIGSFQFSRGAASNSVGQTTGDDVDRAGASALRQGVYGSLGVALRPRNSDRVAAFINYQHRSFGQSGIGVANRERSNTLSVDSFLQASSRVAVFGKVALREVDSSRDKIAASPTLTYLLQGRVEYRIQPRWDLSLESRFLKQPSSGTSRVGVATELGYWVTPDVRFGLGYNRTRAIEQAGRDELDGSRRGFYFSITTKLERVFDFFGAKKKAVGAEAEK